MPIATTETHELRVEGTPSLVVRNVAGSVSVEPESGGRVTVVVTKKSRGLLGGDDRDLANIQVEVTQSGDTITVEAYYPGSHYLKGITVDLDIHVPSEANLDVKLAAGDVHVRGIAGTLKAAMNAGNLEAAAVTLKGGNLELNAGNFNLDGAFAQGASVQVRVNAGNVEVWLPRDTPAQLDARTSVGAIRVSGWQLDTSRHVTQQRASGALGANPQGSLVIHVDAGNIQISARE